MIAINAGPMKVVDKNKYINTHGDNNE